MQEKLMSFKQYIMSIAITIEGIYCSIKRISAGGSLRLNSANGKRRSKKITIAIRKLKNNAVPSGNASVIFCLPLKEKSSPNENNGCNRKNYCN